eukprot:15417052-Alexandrium_andersonii.AAC.1
MGRLMKGIGTLGAGTWTRPLERTERGRDPRAGLERRNGYIHPRRPPGAPSRMTRRPPEAGGPTPTLGRILNRRHC